MRPWELMADPSMYIFNWLNVYSGFLGPVAAIIIADYFIIRKTNLNLFDLYRKEGVYKYHKGINLISVVALVIGVFVAIIGKIVPEFSWLFNYAWFSGFGASFVSYLVIMKLFPRHYEESLAK